MMLAEPAMTAINPVSRDLSRLKETTGKVVGSVFLGEMMKSMRENPLKGKYGHGGRGEEIFSAQLHGVLAERAGGTLQKGLGDVIYKRLARQQELISRAAKSGDRAADTYGGDQ